MSSAHERRLSKFRSARSSATGVGSSAVSERDDSPLNGDFSPSSVGVEMRSTFGGNQQLGSPTAAAASSRASSSSALSASAPLFSSGGARASAPSASYGSLAGSASPPSGAGARKGGEEGLFGGAVPSRHPTRVVSAPGFRYGSHAEGDLGGILDERVGPGGKEDERTGLILGAPSALQDCAWLGARRLSCRAWAAIGLSLAAVLLAILGLIGFYVVAPSLVQSSFAATRIVFTSLNMTAPTGGGGAPAGRRALLGGSGGAESGGGRGGGGGLRFASPGGPDVSDETPFGFTIVASAVLSGLSPLGGTLAAMSTTLSFKGVPVATFILPETAVVADVDNILSINATVALPSLDSFTAFGDALLQGSEIVFSLSGTAVVSTKFLGVTITIGDVPFEKDITMPGLNGLRDNQVLDFSLLDSNATAAVASLVVSIQNPSPVGILPLGDLAVSVVYEGLTLGVMFSSGVTLLPGANNLTFGGVLAPSNVTIIERMISAYLGGFPVNVTAAGIPSWPSSIALYRPLIGSLVLATSLQGTAPPLVAGLSIDGMFLDPQGASSVGVYLNATVSVNNILGANSPITVRSVSINASLVSNGQSVGNLILPATVPSAVSGGGGAPAAAQRALAASSSSSSPPPPDVPTLNVSISVAATLSIGETADQFSAFILDFLSSTTVALGLSSASASAVIVELECVLGNLTVSIPIQTTSTVAGIQGFPNVTVLSFNISSVQALPSPAILVDLVVSLDNPSRAAFTLGTNSTLGIYVGDVRVGASVNYNTTLLSGLNVLSLQGTIAPPDAASAPDGGAAALAAISALFTSYLVGANSSVYVVGESVYLPGGLATPQWLQDAVQNISLSATLPGAANLTVFTDVALSSFGLDWVGGEPYVSATILGAVHLPFSNIPVAIPSIALDLVFLEATTLVPMAHVTVPVAPATYTPAGDSTAAMVVEAGTGGGALGNYPVVGSLLMTLPPTLLLVDDLPRFASFLKDAVISPAASLVLAGTASPIVSLPIGNLSIANVSVNQPTTIVGLDGLASNPPFVVGVDVVNTTLASVIIAVAINVTNPSVISGSLGPATLDLYFNGTNLATVQVDNLVLTPGNNTILSSGGFTLPDPIVEPERYAVAVAFVSNYLSNEPSNVALVGTATSSPYPLLQPAFAALNISASFPGLGAGILTNGTLYLDADIPAYANGTLVLNNPLSVDVALLNASLTVYMCANETANGACVTAPRYGDAIGYFFDGDLSKRPVVARAKSTTVSDPYPIKLLGDFWDDLLLLLQIIYDHQATTKANGTITAQLGEFVITIPYAQYGVPLFVLPKNQTPPIPPELWG